MSLRLSTAIVALNLLASSAALADTTIVSDDFDSYANQGAFEAVWTPDAGDGGTPIGTTGVLLPIALGSNPAFDDTNAQPPGLVGNGVGNFGGINEYNGAAIAAEPSDTQSLVLEGDIFVDGTTGNWRQTIGLRNDSVDREPLVFGPQLGSNILEMGFYNADTCDPTAAGCSTSSETIQNPSDPNFIGSTGFAYRLAIFQFGTLGKLFENGTEVGDLLTTPNWQYFPFDPDLDLAANGGNEDGTANILDLADDGQGFHNFKATITPTDITFELDFFRNGVNEVTGLGEADSTVVVEIGLFEDPSNPGSVAAFDSLRVGGPSGVTSLDGPAGDPAPAVFDNIALTLVDNVVAPDGLAGDYNDDGMVAADDYAVWRSSVGASITLPNESDGVTPGSVTIEDYDEWAGNFGATAAAVAPGVVSVPEPCALAVFCISATALAFRRERREIA